jgi:hypothetical protein
MGTMLFIQTPLLEMLGFLSTISVVGFELSSGESRTVAVKTQGCQLVIGASRQRGDGLRTLCRKVTVGPEKKEWNFRNAAGRAKTVATFTRSDPTSAALGVAHSGSLVRQATNLWADGRLQKKVATLTRNCVVGK